MVSSSSNTSVTCSPSCTVRCFLCASTCSRNCLRALAYCSSDIRLSAVIVPICVLARVHHSKAVGNADQGQRMLLPEGALAKAFISDALLDMAPGNGTVRAYIVRRGGGHLAEDRPAYFHRVGEEFSFDA